MLQWDYRAGGKTRSICTRAVEGGWGGVGGDDGGGVKGVEGWEGGEGRRRGGWRAGGGVEGGGVAEGGVGDVPRYMYARPTMNVIKFKAPSHR